MTILFLIVFLLFFLILWDFLLVCEYGLISFFLSSPYDVCLFLALWQWLEPPVWYWVEWKGQIVPLFQSQKTGIQPVTIKCDIRCFTEDELYQVAISFLFWFAEFLPWTSTAFCLMFFLHLLRLSGAFSSLVYWHGKLHWFLSVEWSLYSQKGPLLIMIDYLLYIL